MVQFRFIYGNKVSTLVTAIYFVADFKELKDDL